MYIKNLILVLFLTLLPMITMGQVNITGTAGTGFYLETAQGDTLQLRGSTPWYSTYRIAMEDAVNHSAETGQIIHVRSNMNERVEADPSYFTEIVEIPIELPPDTVFVDVVETITETDTLYVTEVDTVFLDRVETITETVVEVDTVFVDRIETVVQTDTVFVDRIETIIETEIDTVYIDRIETVIDTVYVDVIETVVETDTLYVTETDTVFVDRVETITDTLYVTEYDTTYIDRIETITDTLYVDRVDTLVVEPDRPVVEWYETGVRYNFEDSVHVLTTLTYTKADSLHIYWDCDTERGPLRRQQYTHSANSGYEVVHDTIGTICNTGLAVQTLFFLEGDTTHVERDYYPGWVVTNTVPNSGTSFSTDFQFLDDLSWQQTWGYLEYDMVNSHMILNLPQRSIARLQWAEVPDHRNIRYKVKETLEASHSTGAHIGGRHSTADSLKHSVETYINRNGLGVSIFHENRWSNPHNFPFVWEYGDVVQYIIEIVDDTIRAKIWKSGEQEPDTWMEYSDPLIGLVPNGGFAIGSTGAGIYPIDKIEVQILD